MAFDKLLADLDTLSKADADMVKSLGDDADDAAIAAAAADGENAGDPEDDDAAAAAAAAPKGEDEGEPVMKSMQITNEAGEAEDVIDATDFLKSLSDKVDTLGSDSAKALGTLVDLVKSQQAQIGTLTKRLSAVAAAGRGRRTVVSVADRPSGPDLNKSMGADPAKPEGLSGSEFLTKALGAMRDGKITGGELASCESRINRGVQPDAAIVSKVLGA